jgi:hypothetical protein
MSGTKMREINTYTTIGHEDQQRERVDVKFMRFITANSD